MTLKPSLKKVNCFKQLRLANPGLKDNISVFIFIYFLKSPYIGYLFAGNVALF